MGNHLEKQSPSKFFVIGILLVGAVLRVPITAIPPVLSNVAASLHVSVNSLGILTTLPLLMFALFSSVAPKLAEKTGLERLFTMVLAIMVIGSLLRIFNVPLLYVGTMIIGAAIAMLNVLLPSVIMANDAYGIGKYTTIYTTAMAIIMAIFSALAVPIVLASSWKALILVLTGLLLVALVVWFPNTKNNHKLHARKANSGKQKSIWSNNIAWAMLVFGGLQSFLFYTGLTWLPTMAQDAGLSQGTAGLLAGVYTLIGLPFSMFLPIALTRMTSRQRQWIMGALSGLGVIGLVLLLFPHSSFAFWLLINILLGLAVGSLFPYMVTAFSLKTNSATDTARLSGMVQTGGYFIAAVGPAGFGYAHSFFGSWLPENIVLLLLTVVMTLCLLYVERFEKIVD